MPSPLTHGVPLPERTQVPHVRCIWHRPVKGDLYATLLSDAWWGAWTHFDGRSYGHIEPAHECHGCDCADPLIWQGYMPALCRAVRGPRVLIVAADAAHQLQAIHKAHGKLRGASVRITRAHNDKRAPTRVELVSWVDPARLPEPFDPQPHVRRFWGPDRRVFRRVRPGATATEAVPVPLSPLGELQPPGIPLPE